MNGFFVHLQTVHPNRSINFDPQNFTKSDHLQDLPKTHTLNDGPSR